MILGISEHLVVGLLLDVVGVCAEPAPQICSVCRFKQEGTHAAGWLGVLHPWIPSYSGCWASPVILSILEHLRVGLPLGVLGVGAEPAP